MDSFVPSIIAQYSVSVDERATIGYHFLDWVIIDPRNLNAYLAIDLLVLVSQAQSACMKPSNLTSPFEMNINPKSIVPQRYLNILLTTSMCGFCGVAIYLLTTPTA
jgi:hypothetical protein